MRDGGQKRLRIMHSEAATTFGGQENRIFREMLALRERGHTLEAICQPASKLSSRLQAEGFRVHEFLMDGVSNYTRAVYGIRGILARGKFDVLNTHSRRDTVIAAMAGRLAGTPLIVRTRHLAKRPGSLWSYTRLPHRVVAVSDYVATQMIERGVPQSHVATVSDAIPISPNDGRSSLREELGIARAAIVIVCVAHLRPQKGQGLLLSAAAPLMNGPADIHLVFAGEGSQLDVLKDMARQHGCQARTHFLGRRADIGNVLAASDIFALATQFEALGTSFIEAAACGLPIVGTRVGGVPEVVKHGETGLLVPYGDVDALRACLETLAADATLRQRMGAAGAAYVRGEKKFSLAGMAESMEAAYLRWLKR
ncbi:glycosyltransferase family 4 protein [Achromobacter xylosoxidans]|uniref:glycosyltransferase family 4 protein n=1 Tax=Alcaligenes xylosoxydans xylosoxydans TaxID=85698 RepID=UPI0007352DC1|nr:glycosyltransferase family 4 protein [Achromobacter xylosoxidans]PNM90247.1 glycosyltransferase family 1 protein [Achromobacter xylosoxidans]